MIINTKLNRKESSIDIESCNVIDVIELDESAFLYFKNHLFEDFEFIADRSNDMFGHDNIRECILVLGENCEDGVIVCSEGYDYARYTSAVPYARTIAELNGIEFNRQYIDERSNDLFDNVDTLYDESCNDDVEIICAKNLLWNLDGTGEKANLRNTGFLNVDIEHKNLNNAFLANVVMKNCSLNGTELCFARAESAVFVNVDFSNVTAEEARFVNCRFDNCTFHKAMFTHSDLSHSDFHDCSFFRTSMHSCLINGTGFTIGDGDIPRTLPNLDGSTQEVDEWINEEAEEGVVQE